MSSRRAPRCRPNERAQRFLSLRVAMLSRHIVCAFVLFVAACGPTRHTTTTIDTNSLPFESNPSEPPVILPPPLPAQSPPKADDAGQPGTARFDASLPAVIDDAGADVDAGRSRDQLVTP
ncbi:MAG: hypothetical protein ACHQ53_09150 [Polyangiales bacterium]